MTFKFESSQADRKFKSFSLNFEFELNFEIHNPQKPLQSYDTFTVLTLNWVPNNLVAIARTPIETIEKIKIQLPEFHFA